MEFKESEQEMANHDVLLQQAIQISLQQQQQQQREAPEAETAAKEKQIVSEMTPAEKEQLARELIAGTKRYQGVFRHIRSFLPGRPGPECNTITSYGKNCSRSYVYIDDKKNEKDCKSYCIKECKQWLPRLITDFPVNAKVDANTVKHVLPITIAVITFHMRAIGSNTVQELSVLKRDNLWYIVTEKAKLNENFLEENLASNLHSRVMYTITELLDTDDVADEPDVKQFSEMFGLPVKQNDLINTILSRMCSDTEPPAHIHINIHLWSRYDTSADEPKTRYKVRGFGSSNRPNDSDIFFQPLRYWHATNIGMMRYLILDRLDAEEGEE